MLKLLALCVHEWVWLHEMNVLIVQCTHLTSIGLCIILALPPGPSRLCMYLNTGVGAKNIEIQHRYIEWVTVQYADTVVLSSYQSNNIAEKTVDMRCVIWEWFYLGFFTSTLSRMKSLQSGERCTNSTHSVSSFRAVMLAMVASCVGPTNGDLPVSLQWGKEKEKWFLHTHTLYR